MRIEAYTQVQQLYKTSRVNRTASANAVGTVKDQLQISNLGKDFQTAKAAVASTPDIREELTAAVKSSVENGTYNVDNSSFAEKLLEKYSALA